jgi:YVTN family beta-propeller protein
MRVTLGLLLLAAACSSTPDNGDGGGQDGGNTDAPNDNNQNTSVAKGPSKGSAIAVSADDSIVVATNRVDGSVSVFAMTYPTSGAPTATKTDVDLGAGSEPWQVAIGPDGDTAYVVLRQAQKLVKIGSLHSGPSKSGEVAVGSEPTGVALSPSGKHAYVANWVDGTVSDVDTSQMKVSSSIDLNAPLAASGALGTVTARPALAHPRSIAVTNNLDTNDDDETLYVTEYFAQQNAAEASDGSNSDVRKNGFVYAIKASDKSVKMITLNPVQDTGFKDENNATTGCYPNQLKSIAIAGKYAYVLSVCASPKGPTGPKVTATTCSTVTDCASLALVSPACAPVDSSAASSVCIDQASTKTTTEPLVSIIDTTSNTEIDGRVNLNQAWQAAYVAANTPDDNTRRYPLVADDIAFVPGTSISYVSANGADGVFRMRFDANSSAVLETGSTVNKFIDLAAASLAANAGQDPIGVAPSNTGKGFLVTMNEHTHNVSFIDLNVQGVSTAFAASALPTANSPEDKVRKGKRFFDTGMGRWSFKGQGWGACQSCHGDGLTDNVTWYFARGPRQSTSLDGTFNKKDPTDQRVLNWTAIFDEVADFEGNTRGTSGGVGSLVNKSSTPPATADRINLASVGGQNHSGLNGAAQQVADPTNPLGLPSGQQGVTDDWLNITAYIKQIRSPRAPTNLDSSKVTAGAALFSQKNCQGCHGGDKWTLSKVFYAPGVVENGNLKSKSWTLAVTGAGFPSSLLPASTPTNQLMRFDQGNPAALDQIQCVLRPVGTFGVAESDVGIAEKRINMTATAQGNETDGKGYNPPSLLGLATGAPYMHAGNARTLESMLSDTFKQHHQAFAVNFLDPSDSQAGTERDQLVAFLLSIDNSTQSVAIPALGATGGDFCAP